MTNQVKKIRNDIIKLRGKGIEIVILLSHSEFDDDKILAGELKKVDVIVGAHSQTLVKQPVKIGNTIIVPAGSNGAHIGILDLTLKNRKVIKFKNYKNAISIFMVAAAVGFSVNLFHPDGYLFI
ncbi:MAG: hypothetical protein GY870_10700 [archaeon]|nr:hypothetical protein [archaeon]